MANLTARLPDFNLTADMPGIKYVGAYIVFEYSAFLDTTGEQVNDTDGNAINLLAYVRTTSDYALALIARMPDLRLNGDI